MSALQEGCRQRSQAEVDGCYIWGMYHKTRLLGPTLFNVFINEITEAVQKRGFLSPPIQLSTEFSLHHSRVCLSATTTGVLPTTSTLSYISKNQALKNKH